MRISVNDLWPLEIDRVKKKHNFSLVRVLYGHSRLTAIIGMCVLRFFDENGNGLGRAYQFIYDSRSEVHYGVSLSVVT